MDGTTHLPVSAAALDRDISQDVRLVSADGIETFANASALAVAMAVRGVACTGTATRASLRAELRGLPTFAGLVGPCWGGDHVRYETSAVHASVSL